MPPDSPSCYVLYTPSMSTPNFGVPPPPPKTQNPVWNHAHTHTFKHIPTPQMTFMKFCHICNHHASHLKSRFLQLPLLKIQIPPVSPLGQFSKWNPGCVCNRFSKVSLNTLVWLCCIWMVHHFFHVFCFVFWTVVVDMHCVYWEPVMRTRSIYFITLFLYIYILLLHSIIYFKTWLNGTRWLEHTVWQLVYLASSRTCSE